ncbi:MAG: hypothetical protein IH946_09720 [Bacteroidetes bacterium]|nr:hypothetical protein [Bacteroidota bacterium]
MDTLFKYSSFIVLFFGLSACDKEVVDPEDENILVKSYDFVVISSANTNDEGYILNCRNKLVKLANDGTEDWKIDNEKYFSQSEGVTILDVYQTSTGEYLLSGISHEPYAQTGANKGNLNVVKMSSKGNIIWKKFYSLSKQMETPIDENSFNIINTIELSSGGYIFTSSMNEKDADDVYVFVKLDTDGNLFFKKKVIFNNGVLKRVAATADDGFIVIGRQGPLFAAMYNDSLNLVWKNTYTHTIKDAFSTEQVANNILEINSQFYITGYLDRGSGNEVNYDFFILKIGVDGEELMFKTFDTGKQDYCLSSTITSDNNIAMLGGKRILVDYSKETNMYFLKASTSGTKEWDHEYGESYGMEGVHVKQNQDETFTLIGYKKGYENSAVDQTIFLQTKADGTTF